MTRTNNMPKVLLMALIALFAQIQLVAQPLSAYYNFQNQFMVWDDGKLIKADYLVPKDYQVGRSAIPFLDNARNFKIYANGKVEKINSGFTNAFWATDNLVAFKNAQMLNVWDNGSIYRLSNLCTNFSVGDSVVLFFDKIKSEFCVYYDGTIHLLEDNLSSTTAHTVFGKQENKKLTDNEDLADGQISKVAVSDNIAAYINFQNRFKIFYQGNTIEQEQYLIKNFGVGRNIVAYVNQNREFIAFYKGATKVIETYEPISYQVGDDVIAFVGSDNYFKIYYDGQVIDIGYFDPEYEVNDNVVTYEDQSGYFHVFYKGKDYILESYVPEAVQAAYNSVAYITRGRMLKLFTDGKTYDVVTADVPFWRLKYDVLQYRFGANMNKVFYKGNLY